MNKYVYEGPVIFFDRCVADHWTGETVATSEKKAKNNLAYQIKKRMNLIPGTKITLPGRISVAS